MDNIFRISAFTTDPSGGNPAGVWVGTELGTPADMLAAARAVGYSETVFAVPATNDDNTYDVRYFSPKAEVPFCGHATIALGVHFGQTVGAGSYMLNTRSGNVGLVVDLRTARIDDTEESTWVATLTSVEPTSSIAPKRLVQGALDSLGWRPELLDSARPTAVAYAGANHLILPVLDRQTLAAASYDFDSMMELMIEHDLTTVDLVWHESDTVIHSRNLFAVGGVVEDPATGAAAAAFVGHLRSSGQIETPTDVTIHQGHDMGRPSLLLVRAPVQGGIQVTGTGVTIPEELQ